jgi:methionyl-tRNA synthetase
MSKTAGTAITLDEAIERHGPDALRYFLLREVGYEADGNFSWERFDERYTADLADGFGNLASRVLTMLAKYRKGVVPASSGSTALDEVGLNAAQEYVSAMDAFDLRGGAEVAWTVVSAGNLFVQQTAPWALAKSGRDAELDQALSALARALCRLAIMTSPYIPAKAQALWQDLGMEGEVAASDWECVQRPPVEGRSASRASILFPKPAIV